MGNLFVRNNVIELEFLSNILFNVNDVKNYEEKILLIKLTKLIKKL